MTDRNRRSDGNDSSSNSLDVERGEAESTALPSRADQERELPAGPMREAIVDATPQPDEDDTVAADRAEAERRGDNLKE